VNKDLKEEEYLLLVKEDVILIQASTKKGAFHGIQTLRQLYISGNGLIPCCEIKDFPAYSYRGFMLDCSRHFVTVKEILKLIDIASIHHLNYFHWHLTDDQGWRIAIPEFEKLTQIGARRKSLNYQEEVWDYHFYNELEIKTVIEYASKRYIEVIPEIDLPGHSGALLTAYPEFACKKEGHFVREQWGVFNETICIGNEEFYDFFRKILDYITKLFPSRYIHIGGDECQIDSWENCPKCNRKLKELGLDSFHEFQTYFTTRISRIIVDEYKKIPIGWDEILDYNIKYSIPEEMIVMVWRNNKAVQKAIKSGHKIINCSLEDGCYLNFYHTDAPEESGNLEVSTIEKVSKYNPIKEIEKKDKNLVIGGQGNLWTEKVYFSKQCEYMMYPRLSILAEKLWNSQDFNSFEKRKEILIERLRKLNIDCYSGPSR